MHVYTYVKNVFVDNSQTRQTRCQKLNCTLVNFNGSLLVTITNSFRQK